MKVKERKKENALVHLNTARFGLDYAQAPLPQDKGIAVLLRSIHNNFLNVLQYITHSARTPCCFGCVSFSSAVMQVKRGQTTNHSHALIDTPSSGYWLPSVCPTTSIFSPSSWKAKILKGNFRME